MEISMPAFCDARICLHSHKCKHRLRGMDKTIQTQERLPCQQAGEAFFVSARGSSSGQGRGAYTPETSVRTWLLAPSALVGPSLLEAAASPCPQPRDWAPR